MKRSSVSSFQRLKIQILLLLFIIGNFYLVQAVSAQPAYLDSLKNELKKNLTDSIRISICQEIGYNLKDSYPGEALDYFFQAYHLARRSRFRDATGTSLAYIGMAFTKMNRFDSALFYIDHAINIFQTDSLPRARSNMGSLMNERANIEKGQGKYKLAIQHYFESNEITGGLDAREKRINLGIGFTNIALVFDEMEQYEKAIFYYAKAIVEFNLGKKELSDLTYLNILNIALMQATLGTIHDYIKLRRLREAAPLLSAEHSSITSLENNDLSAYLYTVWGDYYRAKGQTDKAVSAYNRSIVYARDIGFRKIPPLTALGDIYKQKKDYVSSAAHLKKVLGIIQSSPKAQIKAEVLRRLAEVSFLGKHFSEAAHYFQQFTILSDSLDKIEMKIRINEIEAQYQAQKKADSIFVLQKSNQFQLLTLHRKESQNLAMVIGGLLLFLTGVLFYRTLINKHRLLKQSELLHNQRIQELEKERQFVAMQSVLKGQEQERSRLAKDLHDGVGGLLSGVKLGLSTMKGNVFLSEESAQALGNIIGQLDRSITELRRVSHNMMPEALIKYGLMEALENYCESIDQAGHLKVRLQTYGLQERMDQDGEIILYRIVQELLNNIIKHAEAKQVLIQLVRKENRFSLTVEDDGKGFNLSETEHRKGAGLQNIEARVGYLNGTVDIRTGQGDGTSITIEGTLH